MSYQQAFEKFMTEKFQSSVNRATVGFAKGYSYSVELYSDGGYRVVWDGHLGDSYQSPGILLTIPFLTDDEFDENPANRDYTAAESLIRQTFERVSQ